MQAVFIGGGNVFSTREEYHEYLRGYELDPYSTRRSWRDWIVHGLSDRCECFAPSMPTPKFADYKSWRIWFEKLLPYLTEDVVLVGHSLGGIFLAKYLSENAMPQKIVQLHLVAPPFEDDAEPVSDFAPDPQKLANIKAEKIFLYHSRDDPIVPYAHAKKYVERMGCELISFEDRGHFLQPSFPELFLNLTQDL